MVRYNLTATTTLHILCIYYYCAYFSIRAKAFDIKTMGAGLDAIKRKMQEIAEKRKNNEYENTLKTF